jgi:4-hydroxy-tetrahydrodipicolinate synthase
MFQGSITALVTPFRDGAVDERAFRGLVEWQIAEGSNGLVPVGTTGESPVLSHAEHKRVVELAIETAAGRVPIIAGAGSNNTREAIDLAQHAEHAGADGLLIVTPYYNKPNQEGLYQHFAAIARAVKLPIIIYNIPPRSVIDMMPETMGRLAHDFQNIAGVKDATGKVERVSEQRMTCGSDFIQLSGEDASARPARRPRRARARRPARAGWGRCRCCAPGPPPGSARRGRGSASRVACAASR